MKHQGGKLVFLIAFIILGIAMSVQIKSNLQNMREKSASELKEDNLKLLLSEEKKVGENLRSLIKENESKKEEYINAAGDNNNDEMVKKQLALLETVELKGGLKDVKGKGIIIKLNDALNMMDDNPLDIIIHDSDVYKIINELKKAGAQAISINDERIIATSEQVCGGPTIIVNKNKYAVPFEIKAIGNADLLYDTLSRSEIVAVLRQFRIRVEISKADEVIVPKYHSNIDRLVSGVEVIKSNDK
ncbi:MAG: DUF881 domain-containing protein [Clostridia bacterium]|nr:DUF881 domain-containing protein [Clostridia bacterium]